MTSKKEDPIHLAKRGRSLKHIVFSKSPVICKYLNYQSLRKYLLIPKLEILSNEELELLENESSDTEKANKLLIILHQKSKSSIRKFTACLLLEQEHRGHAELSDSILAEVSTHEKEKIKQIVQKNALQLNEPPPRPVEFIYFTGDLEMGKGCAFHKLDIKLWEYFSTADYSNLETLVDKLVEQDQVPLDWRIIGSWFRALILMHRNHQYSTCIETILEPALQDCKNSENRTILEGRILQRIAQVYLVMKENGKAVTHYQMAKEKLQFVGGGYDKANMFCREAKISSTICTTQEERNSTERLYETALDNVPADSSFALASRPSLLLSKTAFHLHLSFGKGVLGRIPVVSDEDLAKAKKTLKCLPEEHIILAIRKCEYSLLIAEISRLDGQFKSASDGYKKTIDQSTEAKLENITEIAQNRMDHVDSAARQQLANTKTLETLLEGLP